MFERSWLDRFLALLPASASILDLGCGAGEPSAQYFVERGHRVFGVATSPKLLAKCADRFPAHEWRVDDTRELSLGERFDGIVAWDSFFHLRRDDQRHMFEVFARHAGSATALMFTSGAEDGEVVGVLEGDPLYHASLAPGEYRELMQQNGFAVVAYVEDDADCGLHTIWLAQRA